jgi:galactokinase
LVSPSSAVVEAFYRQFPAAGAPRVYRAPGRVNLIGEHTDYNLGFVLPIALDKATYIAASPNAEGKLRIWSENLRESRKWPLDTIAGLQPAKDWSDYSIGVAQQLLAAGFTLAPVNLAIYSTVPVGSGLSSSAALEVSTALALLAGRTIDPLELAKLCQRAEREFVGMPSGIMDQYISVFGRAGSALRIDCRSLESSAATLPPGTAIVVVNTMVKHELGSSAYRVRVRECGEAVEAIAARYPEVKSLRDATMEKLESVAGKMPEVVFRRARHVITEDDRVNAFLEASAKGDRAELGRLFVGSHRSLQHDYEVSCEELDFLVDSAIMLPGVFGARMTGGGFGGCIVSLMEPAAVDAFEAAITSSYQAKYNITPQVFRCVPSEGAGEVKN